MVVALGLLLLVHATNDSFLSINAYVPLIVATMLAIGLAGAEWQVALQQQAAERHARVAELDRAEHQAADRQHTFNQLWQTLADSRGQAELPTSALAELGQLFTANLVAVWSATETHGGFCLRGVHPQAGTAASRLDKIAQATPCFERLRSVTHPLPIHDFARETSQALAIFCEEKHYQHAVLCPVLVRQEIVGVLAFFYQEKPSVSPKVTEEMQSAANLFLCAL